MTTLPRLAGLCLPLATLCGAPSAHASQEPVTPLQPNPALTDPLLTNPFPMVLMSPEPPLPDVVRAMIDAAFASGENGDVEAVVKVARMANPGNIGEIDALVAHYRSGHPPVVPPDPVRNMLAAAIASGKDGDVEAVAKLAIDTHPDDAAEIEARLVAYRAERQRQKDAAAAAARAKLAAAKFWQNWKGEGQIGASHSSGNNKSTGLSLGISLARKGIDVDQRFRAQGDYQRTNGRTSIERYLAEYEPQIRVSDRAFAFGLGRWERDVMQGFDTRWNVSAGLGYKVIANKAMSLNLKAGPAWRKTDFLGSANESEITALAGLDFGWQLSPTLRLTQTASTIVGERTATTSSLTALNAKLTGALSARIAYSADIDSNPPRGIDHVDTLTRFTLVYGF